jgi:hypothetical protein
VAQLGDGIIKSRNKCTNCIINSWECTYVEISLVSIVYLVANNDFHVDLTAVTSDEHHRNRAFGSPTLFTPTTNMSY